MSIANIDFLFNISVFLFAFLFSILFTFVVRIAAERIGVVDKPNLERKKHERAVPLLGGVAIFATFFVILYPLGSKLVERGLEPRHWIGFFVGGLILMIGGFLDDKYHLPPGRQIIFPILAAVAVVAGGVEIAKVSNPLGGYFYLDAVKIPIFLWNGTVYYFTVISDLLIMLWLMGMMYTTKLLDGVDGLVTGIGAIGSFIVFLFTMTTRYFQPDIGLAALVLTAACLGFLIFNWHPAKIFLGEGGSLFLGYALGVLAIISGGKIAIALLIMGIPILDVAWTIVRRLKSGQNPFKFADRRHLHFRMLDLGLTQRQTVLLYYLAAAGFGLLALFFQSIGKLLALAVLVLIMLGIIVAVTYFERHRPHNT